jgi:hypothetical protein
LRSYVREDDRKRQKYRIQNDVGAENFPSRPFLQGRGARRTATYMIGRQLGVVRQGIGDTHDVEQEGQEECNWENGFSPERAEIGTGKHGNEENYERSLIFSQTLV